MNLLSRLFLAFASVLCALALPAQAQFVTTGVIEKVDATSGTLMVRSDQTKALLSLQGASQAVIQQEQGQPAMLADLAAGMPVTVQYTEQQKQWFVSKIFVPNMKAPAAAAVPATTATTTTTTTGGSTSGTASAPVVNNPNNTDLSNVPHSSDANTLTRNRGGGNARGVIGAP